MYTLAPGEARVPAPHIFDTFNTEQKSTRIKVRVDNDSHSLRKWLARVETLLASSFSGVYTRDPQILGRSRPPMSTTS